MTKAASFRHTLFLTRVPKGAGRFLMRRLASLIYCILPKKKSSTLYKAWLIEDGRSNRIYTQYNLLLFLLYTISFIVLSLPCPSNPRVLFDLYRFALKIGRLSSTKVRGSLLLCSESIRSSSRKHDHYPGVAWQFCVPSVPYFLGSAKSVHVC
jgi:hypothetical protein